MLETLPNTRLPGKTCGRARGITALELAVILPVVLMLLLGTADLGIAVYFYNSLSEAARAGTRYAAVHGSNSQQAVGPSANDATVEDRVRRNVPGISSADLTVTSSWPDGNNAPGSRVIVTTDLNYKLAVTGLLGFKSVRLTSASTMYIVH